MYGTLENVFGCLSLVLWKVQLVPQVVHTHRRQSTYGMSAIMFGIWCLGNLPLAPYVLYRQLSVFLILQPHTFYLLAGVCLLQYFYFGPQPPIDYHLKRKLVLRNSKQKPSSLSASSPTTPFRNGGEHDDIRNNKNNNNNNNNSDNVDLELNALAVVTVEDQPGTAVDTSRSSRHPPSSASASSSSGEDEETAGRTSPSGEHDQKQRHQPPHQPPQQPPASGHWPSLKWERYSFTHRLGLADPGRTRWQRLRVSGVACAVLLAVWAASELGIYHALAGIPQSDAATSRLQAAFLVCTVVPGVMALVGIMPQLVSVVRLRSACGLSVTFLAMDIGGGLFGLVSLVFRDLDRDDETFDVLTSVLYITVIIGQLALLTLWFVYRKNHP